MVVIKFALIISETTLTSNYICLSIFLIAIRYYLNANVSADIYEKLSTFVEKFAEDVLAVPCTRCLLILRVL